MAGFKTPDFNERTAAARNAKQRALELLRNKPAPDAEAVAARQAARAAREAAAAERRAAHQAAIEEARLARLAKAEAAAAAAAEAAAAAAAAAEKRASKRVQLSAEELKAARDARYAARKARQR